MQIVPRKTSTDGRQGSITGTFDLVVKPAGKAEQRVDLGALIGKGGSNRLTFATRKSALVFQDLNHDGTLDTDILHGSDGYALVSFDARPSDPPGFRDARRRVCRSLRHAAAGTDFE